MSSEHASFVQGIVHRVFISNTNKPVSNQPLRMFKKIMEVYTNLIELYRADGSVYNAYKAKAEKLKEKYEAFISGQSATLEEQLEEAVRTLETNIHGMKAQLTVKVDPDRIAGLEEKIREAEAKLKGIQKVKPKRRIQKNEDGSVDI